MMCFSKGNRKSRKDRQYNDQMQNEKRTNNDLQNRKLKDEQYESYKKNEAEHIPVEFIFVGSK